MRRLLPVLLSALVLTGCGDPPSPGATSAPGVAGATSPPVRPSRPFDPMSDKVLKTDDQWREILTQEQFRVLRKHGTERAFTGAHWKTKESGIYRCAGCGLELFRSEHKFDSGTGWPSYWQPFEPKNVGTREDRGFFMTRTEVHCARCEGHLGHVFDDGPAPTGLRYCINSASLRFEPTPSSPSASSPASP